MSMNCPQLTIPLLPPNFPSTTAQQTTTDQRSMKDKIRVNLSVQGHETPLRKTTMKLRLQFLAMYMMIF